MAIYFDHGESVVVYNINPTSENESETSRFKPDFDVAMVYLIESFRLN